MNGRVARRAKSCKDVPQVCFEAHASCGRRRRNRRCPGRVFQRLLCPGSSPSQWFTASCCSDGSLAVLQPLRLQKTSAVPSMVEGAATTHTGAHPTSNAGTSLGRHCSTTHFYQSSPCGSVHAHFAGDVHACIRAPGTEKEGCPTAGAISPMLVCRDRSFRNWSVYQDRGPRRVGPGSSSSCPGSRRGLQRTASGISIILLQQRCSRQQRTPRHSPPRPCAQTRHSGDSIDRFCGFRIVQEVQKRCQ